MKVLVCGGRDYYDPSQMWAVLDSLDCFNYISCVIDGAANGADYWGNQWALARNRPTIRFHADWETHGKAAGPIRNRQMLIEGKPDLVVAFPGGAGTANMVSQAKKAGIPVRVIE